MLPTPDFQATTCLQLVSPFFGRIPLEIRDMIYSELWTTSGPRQHVFSRNGRLAHCPCLLTEGKDDKKDDEFEEVWQNRRRSRTGSIMVDEKWASRFSSSWNDHWICEEEMLSDAKRGSRAPFLPALLTCKRM